jgi:tetratricopeptide (TPR) repeat protein
VLKNSPCLSTRDSECKADEDADFWLGAAYFELQNWEFARQSFEKAAERNPKLPPAVYNVALCYVKPGYYRDAVRWYEEYLRRDPSASDRSDVETTIGKLKTH